MSRFQNFATRESKGRPWSIPNGSTDQYIHADNDKYTVLTLQRPQINANGNTGGGGVMFAKLCSQTKWWGDVTYTVPLHCFLLPRFRTRDEKQRLPLINTQYQHWQLPTLPHCWWIPPTNSTARLIDLMPHLIWQVTCPGLTPDTQGAVW